MATTFKKKQEVKYTYNNAFISSQEDREKLAKQVLDGSIWIEVKEMGGNTDGTEFMTLKINNIDPKKL